MTWNHVYDARERFLCRMSTQLRTKLGLAPSRRQLDPELSEREIHFRAPPLAPELLAAIRRISPQFHLDADERSRDFWQRNQNGLCWGELDAVEAWLRPLPVPGKVLDIGPGLGRSAVFLRAALGWEAAEFHLYEGSGSETRYTRSGPRFEDSFCGDLEALETVLRYNGMERFRIFDAHELGARLAGLPGPYDVLYSFYAIGFHWSIDLFLDEILDLMHDRSVAVFTLHYRSPDLGRAAELPHREVAFRPSWPRGERGRLLVLAKSEAALEAA